MNQTNHGNYLGHQPELEWLRSFTRGFHDIGYGFAFDYDVALERTVKDTQYYKIFVDNNGISHESRGHGLHENEVVIDWTVDREAFLKKLKGAMLNIVCQLGQFMQSGSDGVTQMIDTGKLNILSEPKKE
jgi:hypothetical protein